MSRVETRRWEELRADLPDNARICTVSVDLPFARARWRCHESVEHHALSTHASEDFRRDCGMLLKEWRSLSAQSPSSRRRRRQAR
jgi:peroxiredoxin